MDQWRWADRNRDRAGRVGRDRAGGEGEVEGSEGRGREEGAGRVETQTMSVTGKVLISLSSLCLPAS